MVNRSRRSLHVVLLTVLMFAGFVTSQPTSSVAAQFSATVVASVATPVADGTPLADSSPVAAADRLSYHGGRYLLLVDTDPSWAGTCRRLAVTLDDGTTHVASVRFG